MLPTNLEECKALRFDVVILPAGSHGLLNTVREFNLNTGREHTEFLHVFEVGEHRFPVICFALAQREGVIAPVLKARKAAIKAGRETVL